jgi:hypothetical protein
MRVENVWGVYHPQRTMAMLQILQPQTGKFCKEKKIPFKKCQKRAKKESK